MAARFEWGAHDGFFESSMGSPFASCCTLRCCHGCALKLCLLPYPQYNTRSLISVLRLLSLLSLPPPPLSLPLSCLPPSSPLPLLSPPLPPCPPLALSPTLLSLPPSRPPLPPPSPPSPLPRLPSVLPTLLLPVLSPSPPLPFLGQTSLQLLRSALLLPSSLPLSVSLPLPLLSLSP